MKPAVKAALLSAFLFPGVGQIYLKRYLRGLAFLIPALGGIAIIVVNFVRAVWESLNMIGVGGGAIDPAVIDRVVRSTDYTGTISSIIIGLWTFSVIDAYYVGKGKSIKSKSMSPPTTTSKPTG